MSNCKWWSIYSLDLCFLLCVYLKVLIFILENNQFSRFLYTNIFVFITQKKLIRIKIFLSWSKQASQEGGEEVHQAACTPRSFQKHCARPWEGDRATCSLVLPKPLLTQSKIHLRGQPALALHRDWFWAWCCPYLFLCPICVGLCSLVQPWPLSRWYFN